MHITSFRKIKQFEILQMIQYFASKHNKVFTLYNADTERIPINNDQIETILHEFHDAPLGGHVGSLRMRKRIGFIFI